MGLFDGKKGLILGVANDRSIAWSAAQFIAAEGGVCGYSHLPDKPDDARQKNRRRVAQLVEGLPSTKFLVPLDVQSDEHIAALMETARQELGTIDFLLHSIAFADINDLKGETVATSRSGFKLAMDISAYSLLAVCNAAIPLLAPDASIVTMTYYGGEKCVAGYNVMGICKAALDACVKYLAYDMGPRGVRVNAVSAGPLKTLASSAVKAGGMLELYQRMSPMQRNVTHEQVARSVGFLLSSMSEGITGEILHHDCGFNIMGSPGRMLDEYRAQLGE